MKNKRLFPIHNRQKILFTPFYTKKRVVESGKCNILWDMTIQCDHVIEARRPDIVVVEKENNKAIIVDITSSRDQRVYEKEGEKIENIRT